MSPPSGAQKRKKQCEINVVFLSYKKFFTKTRDEND